jgi:hypothetical protein
MKLPFNRILFKTEFTTSQKAQSVSTAQTDRQFLYKEVIAVGCDNYGSTKTFCGYNVELLSVKAAGVPNV